MAQRESGAAKAAPLFQAGVLNQEGGVDDIQVGWGMLRGIYTRPNCLTGPLQLRDWKPVNRNRKGRDKRSMNDWQRVRSLCRNHLLAAVMRRVPWIAAHVMAALH